MPDISELPQDCHARRPAKMYSAVLTPIASPKETKLSAFAKKAGLSFHRISLKGASTSTNATSHMDHQACAESTPGARTGKEGSIVHAHPDFPATHPSNASTSTNARSPTLAVKMPSARTRKVPTPACAQREQSPIPILLFDASQSFLVKRVPTALATPSATLTSAACAPNRTLAMTVDILARISIAARTPSAD